MAGYCGTEAQRRLQAQAEANVDFINSTAGACQTGRMMGCDEPNAFGWERIDAVLGRDGFLGFRLVPAAKADEIRSGLTRRDCRFDTWDVFLAERETALAASEAIVSRGLPDGLAEMDGPVEAEGDATVRVQGLMAEAGVTPFSGSFLTGALGPAVTIVVGDAEGAIAAVAHGYMPHNAHSPFHYYGWGGLVAVAEAWRGKGLGTYINALMIVRVFRDLGATHVYELVSTSNVPSRRMVESCGLRFEPSLVCGIASSQSSKRFTR